jgi:hypothetical protein
MLASNWMLAVIPMHPPTMFRMRPPQYSLRHVLPQPLEAWNHVTAWLCNDSV